MTRRRYHIEHLGRCLVLLAVSAAAGCTAPANQDVPSTSTNSLSVEATPKRTLVHVHSSLLEQGRVAVVDVAPFAHAGATLVPGEVAPAPDGEAEIGSLVRGRVASLDAVEGNPVKRGQALAWIDSPEVGGMRADMVRAGGQVVAAKKRWERQLALQAQGATSQSALDEAKATLFSAEADQQAANARLQAVGVNGAPTTGKIALRSPIDGIVVERHTTLGAAVASDTTLFRVVDLHKLRVKAYWSESLGPLPGLQTPVELSLRTHRASEPKQRCAGTVEAQLGLVNAATRSVTLQIVPNASCPIFSSGAYVDVLIGSQTREPAPAGWTQVPIEAVVDLRGIPTVFVATPQAGEFEVRSVVPHASLGSIVPIEVGLNVGEKAVSAGTILLKGEALTEILGAD